jgi:hypothetical protein
MPVSFPLKFHSTVTDRYVNMAKDGKFRAVVAERIGLGFDMPKIETVEFQTL